MTSASAQTAADAVAIDGIESAAIFLTDPAEPSGELRLGGAAGIAGPPLDGLVAAVGNPAHPIRRSVEDPDATFDVRPMNPGGPALRSHLPIRAADGRTLGVLAVAHEAPMSAPSRAALATLATSLADALAADD
jgi:hypothetical protein